MTITNTYETIPLNRLVLSKANARRTGRKIGIAALAASIMAHGLRQNLNVRPTTCGRFEVVAGGRRLRALKLLAKDGRLAKDVPVTCLILAAADNPGEISLVENVLRETMHPDDQCEAFRSRIDDEGMSVEDVAARFGVTPAVVRQRLKLANVAPALRALYRKGMMTLEHMMALAISDDHAAQQEAWDNLPEWNRAPRLLKEALTHGAVPLSDKLALFVGVDGYVAAGGAVLRDLFDNEDEGYLPDRALVLRLASAKLAEAVDTVRAEGWKWVTSEITCDYGTAYSRIVPFSAEDESGPAYSPEDMARAGARVLLERDGTLRIERGLVHPDDLAKAAKPETPARRTANPADLPASVVEELTAHRSAALRVELVRNPAIALTATVHAMAFALLYPGSGSETCLAVRASSETLSRHMQTADDSAAHAAMAAVASAWGDRLPGDPIDLWAWCLAQSQEVLLDLLAYLCALTVNAVQSKHDHPQSARLTHADQLAEALGLDMGQWWTPSIDGFYRRLPKATLAHAVRDAGLRSSGLAVTSLKKDEAARHVAQVLTGSGWLPLPLRCPTAAQAA